MTAHWTLSPTRSISLDRPRLMAILNVTPDSFSDGALDDGPQASARRAFSMIEAGADLIDVGGESTRPGAAAVDAPEQIARVVPVIERIRAVRDVPISIDTTSATVAAAALRAGADVINDVSAGEADPAMLPLAAARACGIVLMHRLLAPQRDRYSTQYRTPPMSGDVVGQVLASLTARAQAACEAGVERSAIVLDPGLGFGKSVDQNWELIHQTPRLMELGWPLLGAASRKSFLMTEAQEPPAQRGRASVAASILQFRGGVRLFRVHDVALHAMGLAQANTAGLSVSS